MREIWSSALNDALLAFRSNLTSAQSSSWKRAPVTSKESSGSNSKGKLRAPVRADAKDVSIHRKSTKSGELFRVVLDLPALDNVNDLEAWKAILVTPELRQEWDPAVESARVLEMYEPSTRIVKTKFTLGWPAK